MVRRSDKLYMNPRVIHRAVTLTPAGSAGAAVAEVFVPTPPGRVTHVAIDYVGTAAATTDVVLTADGLSDGSTGTAFFTVDDNATDIAPRPLGSPAATDEARNATAATDGTEGGRFVKTGVHIDIREADPNEAIKVEFWLERLRYEVVELVSQSGADGSGVVTRFVNYNGAGNLIGTHVDFQNMPATTDLLIKADSTSGYTILTSTSSVTDFGPVAIGQPGGDETNAAVAATDGIGGGGVFRRGLFYDVAQADAFTSGNEKIVIHTWVRQ
jgi:hypothetical protein